MANFKIRDYRREDESAVADLYMLTFAEPPWNKRISFDKASGEVHGNSVQPAFIGLVATDAENIVGFRFAYPLTENVFRFLSPVIKRPALNSAKIGVHPDYRRRGIARTMMLETIKRAHEKGFKQLVGRTKNHDAMGSLYAELGYKSLGRMDPQDPERVYYVLDL